ncbi:DUF421 domain-containing protein [Alteromonas pelagimontana]|uniref:DUF421 domain-containing protein n=1 Tax=Alteromonas pelagimontana TaxID=1858656 RepID=A0A6M4MER8_9ALTE|nr:YetF domain-containing protein [Alteromonas pelagimontana]QJR81674.1 DUF421 domain-containing protein [Alteromonas pelagimontana]
MEQAFFDGWTVLLRTLVVGVLAYICLIVFLRITGKRTLSKMNAFDFVVTVALGSTLATILLSKDVSLAQGALALAILIGLQYIITWASVRTRWIKQTVTGEPTMLLFRGEFIDNALSRSRVTQDEVMAAIRSAGIASLDDIEAVVLETDGSFSVVKQSENPGYQSLSGIKNAPYKDNKKS